MLSLKPPLPQALTPPLDCIVTSCGGFPLFRIVGTPARPPAAINRLTLCQARTPHPVDPMRSEGYQESVVSGVIAPERKNVMKIGMLLYPNADG